MSAVSYLRLIVFSFLCFLTSCSSFQKDSGEPLRGIDLDWPVNRARLTQKFRPYGRDPHQGIDMAASRGTAIYAAHDGTVVYTGSGYNGYGKLIIIEQGEEWATFYAHLHRIEVSEGDKVTKGQRIAQMGNTGKSSGTHLHFEVRRRLEPIDPLKYLQ